MASWTSLCCSRRNRYERHEEDTDVLKLHGSNIILPYAQVPNGPSKDAAKPWLGACVSVPGTNNRASYTCLGPGGGCGSCLRPFCSLCKGFCTVIVILLIGFFYVLYFNLNSFQAWALERPGNPLSELYLPFISIVEGFWAMNPVYLDSQRLKFGDNFCVAGQVALGSWQEVEASLTQPEARTTCLGASPLIRRFLPSRYEGEQLTFLLAISSKGAGGDGSHGAFKEAISSVWFNHQSALRQRDSVTEGLLEDLGNEYVATFWSEDFSKEEAAETFFFTPGRGWMMFQIRYLHYVLFGIDPKNEEAMDLFSKLYHGAGPSHYLEPIGFVFNPEGVHAMKKATIEYYVESEPLQSYKGGSQFHNLSRSEMMESMVPIMAIAAGQGPMHLGRTAMGAQKLPKYAGAEKIGARSPADVDLMTLWDTLDLEDDEALELYLLECIRLFAPVSATHRVATEPISVEVAGKMRTFPVGTKVNIPILLASLSENLWGATVYEFNPQRANLKGQTMGFNGVGEKSSGRLCPGKDLALFMLTDVLRAVGRARRAAGSTV